MGDAADRPTSGAPVEVEAFAPSARRSRRIVERYAGVAVVVLLFVIFALLEPNTFPTYDNLVGVVGNSALGGIVALGLIAPLAAGVFDLSIAGVMTLSVVAVTYLFQSTHGSFPVWLACLVVLLGAVLVGLFNAFFVLRLRVEPFIATLGASSVLVGASQLIGNGTTISNFIPESFTNFGRAEVAQIPIVVFIFLALAIVLWYVFTYTPFGTGMYATGAAREAARLAGIRTNRIVAIGFCVSALGAAIAGIIYAAENGSGPAGVGESYLLNAYATAYLGSTIIRPGRFNVGGLIVALLIISIGINGLQLTGLPFWVAETFQGVALLAAVALGRMRGAERA